MLRDTHTNRSLMEPGDTIAAIATARGTAALAIVRVSGPKAVAIVDECFSGDLADAPSHTVHVGWIRDDGGADIDQVVVTLFRSPRSVTGEDVVEVSCHGGDIAPQRVMRRLVEAGARPAEAGEFTQRAFLNGKMDLTQAEAVADLIHAGSTAAGRTAAAHLAGDLARQVADLRDQLVNTKALIELELDFSEEDVAFADRRQVEGLLTRIAHQLDDLIATRRLGGLVRDGVRVVIAGRPNAGKSTLLNALVQGDRVIVSPQPGTTRDAVEVEREIDGLRFRFLDTAGLRLTEDDIEAEGVRRAEAAAADADLLLYLYDVRDGLDDEEKAWLDRRAASEPHAAHLLVANKIDLLPAGASLTDADIAISAHEARHDPDALSPLIETMLDAVGAAGLRNTEVAQILVNERQRAALSKALDAVEGARRALRTGSTGDTLALDLREAMHYLGLVSGEVTTEDVLGAIFSQFCIGK